MNQKYLYLALELSCLAIPLLFSFHPKYNFTRKWKYVLPAMLLTAIVFVFWDEAFTRLGIWSFNSRYITGIFIFSLPLEEVLFFICIPYACSFTFWALNHLVKKDYLSDYQYPISFVLAVGLAIAGFIYIEKTYTSFIFLITASFLIGQRFIFKPAYMGRFYIAFLVILVPFFFVNGILTGSFIDEAVVIYNNHENLGLRLGTIPVEDIAYGMLLMLMNITISEQLEIRARDLS